MNKNDKYKDNDSDKVGCEVDGDFGIELVYVKGGTFTMGDSPLDPEHDVTLSDFKIGKYEITQKQWKVVMCNNPSLYDKGDNYPVKNVSWDDVQQFITKLNELTKKNYRLPTEAEWEYAARGGSKSKGYIYSGSNNIDDVAWYDGNSSGKSKCTRVRPVGTKQPNELGIYDMSGNVVEWCNDLYGDYSKDSQDNPTGPSSGYARVLRGGCWCDDADSCRVACRERTYPSNNDFPVGFRVVLP